MLCLYSVYSLYTGYKVIFVLLNISSIPQDRKKGNTF